MANASGNDNLETTAYNPVADARERLKGIEGEVKNLKEEIQRHYATLKDLEKAKVWMIVTIGGAIISVLFGCISVIILLLRMFGVA